MVRLIMVCFEAQRVPFSSNGVPSAPFCLNNGNRPAISAKQGIVSKTTLMGIILIEFSDPNQKFLNH